jgi:hypothetical protein
MGNPGISLARELNWIASEPLGSQPDVAATCDGPDHTCRGRRSRWSRVLSLAAGVCGFALIACCNVLGPSDRGSSNEGASEGLLVRPRVLASVGHNSCSQHTLGVLHRRAEWVAVRFGACRDGKSRFIVFDRSGRRLWSSDTRDAAKAFNTNGTGRVGPDQIGSQWAEQTVWSLRGGELLFQVRRATNAESINERGQQQPSAIFHADAFDARTANPVGRMLDFPARHSANAFGSLSPTGQAMAFTDFDYDPSDPLPARMPAGIALHSVSAPQDGPRRFPLTDVAAQLGLSATDFWQPRKLDWATEEELLIAGPVRPYSTSADTTEIIVARWSLREPDKLTRVTAWKPPASPGRPGNTGLVQWQVSSLGFVASVNNEYRPDGWVEHIFRLHDDRGELLKKEAACLAWGYRYLEPCDQRADGLWWPHFTNDGEHLITRRGTGSIEVYRTRPFTLLKSYPARSFGLDAIDDVDVAEESNEIAVCHKATCVVADLFR